MAEPELDAFVEQWIGETMDESRDETVRLARFFMERDVDFAVALLSMSRLIALVGRSQLNLPTEAFSELIDAALKDYDRFREETDH